MNILGLKIEPRGVPGRNKWTSDTKLEVTHQMQPQHSGFLSYNTRHMDANMTVLPQICALLEQKKKNKG